MFGSNAYLLKLAADLRASYWFLPLAFVVVAIGLAEAMLWVDRNPDVLPFAAPDALLETQVNGARAVMTVIAQAVIGVAGVMFSMTIVAVTFASGNYGPRLIGNFMRDRGTQVSLGVLISTFVYAMLVLRAVQGGDGDGVVEFVPHYALLVGFVLTLAGVITMIYFVHHIPETINVANISAGLGARFSRDVRAVIDDRRAREGDAVEGREAGQTRTEITLNQPGYVQKLDYARLKELAEEKDWMLDIHRETGAFVSVQDAAAVIHSDGEVSDEDISAVTSCYAMGSTPTEAENVTFILDQLVEMIARAMSPGVNDPFTAINCMNWMYAGLADALCHEGGLRPARRGRVQYHGVTFDSLLEASFAACRPYAAPDALAYGQWQKLLTRLRAFADGEAGRAIDALLAE